MRLDFCDWVAFNFRVKFDAAHVINVHLLAVEENYELIILCRDTSVQAIHAKAFHHTLIEDALLYFDAKKLLAVRGCLSEVLVDAEKVLIGLHDNDLGQGSGRKERYYFGVACDSSVLQLL